MDEYLGSDDKIRVQTKVARLRQWVSETPGAVDGVRLLATENPEVLGWDTVFEHLREDGLFGFRMQSAEQVRTISERVGAEGYRLDCWNVFVGGCEQVMEATGPLVGERMPDGFHLLDEDVSARPQIADAARKLMVECGVSPFPLSVLSGEVGPACLTLISDHRGNLAACAFCHPPYGPLSKWQRHAWAGLVAVSPTHRGKGLGTVVNALMARAAFERLGVDFVHENVSPDNAASRAMIERCGLRHEGRYFSCVATRGVKFTR